MRDSLFRDNFLLILTSDRFKNVCYRKWGDERKENVLICVHGLVRNHLDFDVLAQSGAETVDWLGTSMGVSSELKWRQKKFSNSTHDS